MSNFVFDNLERVAGDGSAAPRVAAPTPRTIDRQADILAPFGETGESGGGFSHAVVFTLTLVSSEDLELLAPLGADEEHPTSESGQFVAVLTSPSEGDAKTIDHGLIMPVEWVGDDLEEIMKWSRSVDARKFIFQEVESAFHDNVSLVTSKIGELTDQKRLSRVSPFVDDNDPRKRRRREQVEEEVNENLTSTVEENIELSQASRRNAQSQAPMLSAQANQLFTELKKVMTEIKLADSEALSTHASLLQANLGVPKRNQGSLSVTDQLARLTQQSDDRQSKMDEALQSLGEETDQIRNELEKGSLNDAQQSEVGNQVQALKTHLEGDMTSAVGMFCNFDDRWKKGRDPLKRVETLESRLRGQSPRGMGFSDRGSSHEQVSELEQKFESLAQEVRVILKQDEQSGKVVKLQGQRFSNPVDIAAWLAQMGTSDQKFTLFVDPSAFPALCNMTPESFKSAIDSDVGIGRAGCGSTELAVVTKSFILDIPEIFTRGEASHFATGDSLLSAMKTWDVCDGKSSMDGFRTEMLDRMNSTGEKLEHLALGGSHLDSTGQSVAADCMMSAFAFCQRLLGWIDKTHCELRQDSPGCLKDHWHCINQCVRQTFKFLHKRRAIKGCAEDKGELLAWGVLQGRVAAQELLDKDFTDHQVVHNVLSKHMRTRALMREEHDKTQSDPRNQSRSLEERLEKKITDSAGRVNRSVGPTRGIEHRVLRKGKVRCGTAERFSSPWNWMIGMRGKVLWTRRVSLPGEHDRCLSSPDTVDHVLLQGDWGDAPASVWGDPNTKGVIRCSVGPKRRSRGTKRGWKEAFGTRHNLPHGWNVHTCSLSHASLGGATNGRFSLEWASPESEKEVKLEVTKRFANTLSVVSEAKHNRGRKVKEPAPFAVNSAKGSLRWGEWNHAVKAPHRHLPNTWTERALTLKEKWACLDLPGDKLQTLAVHEAEHIIQHATPGKALDAALTLTEGDGKKAVSSAGSKRKREDVTLLPLKTRKRTKTQNMFDVTELENDTGHEANDWIRNGLEDLQDQPNIPVEDLISDKATKADDAKVPEVLWDIRIGRLLQECWESCDNPIVPLDSRWTTESQAADRSSTQDADWLRFRWALRRVRAFALSVWKKRVRRDFQQWFNSPKPTHPSREAILQSGLAACDKADKASWWEWDKGSAIFFWRWPEEHQEDVRVGISPMFEESAPKNQDRQPPHQDEETKGKVKAKVDKVVKKGCMEKANAEELDAFMFMFHVPKGVDDMRMVHDGSKSGLNSSLHAPWFALPTVDTVARGANPGNWLADDDHGEQFPNFPLHPDLRRYCGVDLSQLHPESSPDGEPGGFPTGVWTRSAMGPKSSPENSVQGALRAKRIMLGDPEDPSNPFQWERVILNLPGMASCNPQLPWLRRVRRDGLDAAGIEQCVDDVRVFAPTREIAWRCSSRIAKKLAWLGLQDAARKRRAPSQEPGAWAGATISANQNAVCKSVAQEQWEKVRDRVRWFGNELGSQDKFSSPAHPSVCKVREGEVKPTPSAIHFKTAESCVGFMVCASLTFASMAPCLKGIHQTLNSWRGNQDEEGWKKPHAAQSVEGPPPPWVEPAPRLRSDIQALMELTELEEPPRTPVRATNPKLWCAVGDASGEGFGSATWNPDDDEVLAEFGAWTPEITHGKSSNFREASNLARRATSLIESGEIQKGSELFVFTDNAATERAMFKGTARSKELHNLALDSRALEMKGDLHMHFVWISGNRMTQHGVDGLSRGDCSSGVMAGEEFPTNLPLSLSAFQRHTPLEREVKGWGVNFHGLEWKVSKPEDWFHNVFLNPEAAWMWSPPPTLARAAVEQLCEVHHAHPKSRHVFVCPTLMTGTWRKLLQKLSDVTMTIEHGSCVWPENMHEPLTIAFVCPISSTWPWKADRTDRVASWADNVLPMSCSGTKALRSHNDPFPVLEGVFGDDDADTDSPEALADEKDRFTAARDGDHLLTVFQCEHCHFWNMKKRNVVSGHKPDDLLLLAMKRAILDGFWCGEPSTVRANRNELRRLCNTATLMGLESSIFPKRGPFPKHDNWGMHVACCMLLRSLSPGRNAEHMQFDSIRKMRSAHANFVHTTPGGLGSTLMGESGVKTGTETNAETHHAWFKRFLEGCHRRMGDVWIPDDPFASETMKTSLTLLEADWNDEDRGLASKLNASLSACLVIAGFFGALRGEEIPRIHLGEMRNAWQSAVADVTPREAHVPPILKGRFKGDMVDKKSMQPLTVVTESGRDLTRWFARAMRCSEQEGIANGCLFRSDGTNECKSSVSDLNGLLHPLLERIQREDNRIAPKGIDVRKRHNVRRSFRRGSTTEADNRKISDSDIEANNRWRRRDSSGGRRPKPKTRQHHFDSRAGIPTLARHSYELD